MGNKDVQNQTLEISPFDGIDHAALIVMFYEAGADPDIGKELSIRLLKHAGYTGDPATEPLTGRDGKPVLDDETSEPLTLADYVNYATDHHFYALEGILDFLHTNPGEPEYEQGRAAYAAYVREPQTGTA